MTGTRSDFRTPAGLTSFSEAAESDECARMEVTNPLLIDHLPSEPFGRSHSAIPSSSNKVLETLGDRWKLISEEVYGSAQRGSKRNNDRRVTSARGSELHHTSLIRS